MTSELPFQIVFVLCFVATVFFGARAGKRAAAAHGTGVNQLGSEVRGMIPVRAALGLFFYAALGTWLFAPGRVRWAYVPLPVWARLAGVLLAALGVTFLAWSFRTIGLNYRGGVGLYERHVLVTDGPYRFVRHPIYLGFVWVMAAVFLLSADWVLGMSGLILVTLIAIARVPAEERELSARFAGRWDSYQRATGAFLPRPRLRRL